MYRGFVRYGLKGQTRSIARKTSLCEGGITGYKANSSNVLPVVFLLHIVIPDFFYLMKFGFIILATPVLASWRPAYPEWYDEMGRTAGFMDTVIRIRFLDPEFRVMSSAASPVEKDFVLALADGLSEWDPKNERIKAVCMKVNAEPGWALTQLHSVLERHMTSDPEETLKAVMSSHFVLMMSVRLYFPAFGRAAANRFIETLISLDEPHRRHQASDAEMIGPFEFWGLSWQKPCNLRKLITGGKRDLSFRRGVEWALR